MDKISTVYVVGYGSYCETVNDELLNLKPLLKQQCRKTFRRIDRFIQLSLLGASKCVGEGEVIENTGIYLGSHLGAIANPIDIVHQIFDQGFSPSPLGFVNTLGNSACFYLGQNFDLNSRGSCISQGEQSFEAALKIAVLDMKCGLSDAALVGGVDECPLPIADQKARLSLGKNISLSEVSGWLQLIPVQRDSAQARVSIIESGTIKECLEALSSYSVDQYLTTNSLLPVIQEIIAGRHVVSFESSQGYNPSQSSLGVISLVEAAYTENKVGVYLSPVAENSCLAIVVEPL